MLTIFRGTRADDLVRQLASRRAQLDPADPMVAEVMCVPARGLERWINQQLAVLGGGSDGICANVEFKILHNFVLDVARIGLPPDVEAWANRQLIWAIAQAIDAHRGADWLSLVTAQIEAGAVNGRTDRVATIQYIRDLFDTYHWQRPDMVRAWRSGNDLNAAGQPLTERSMWQPRLWRVVREVIGQPSPPELLASLSDRLPAAAARGDLPQRLSVFELTRMPIGQLEIITKLAETIDVDLFILHPSPVLWDLCATEVMRETATVARADDALLQHCHNELLASWGTDSIELQRCLAQVCPDAAVNSIDIAPRDDRVSDLAHLQRAISHNENASPTTRSDGSISIHGCHGPRRQVEVLRDSILHALRDDPDLEPRDIVVMCPDIETYAAHIQAVFDSHRQLRVRLADRAAVATNPLIAATSSLLELVDSRCTSVDVLALLSEEPVRNRFALTDDSLARIEQWISAAGIRWGLDADHRRSWHVPNTSVNTWLAGLDRIVLGAAMADEDQRVINGTRPIDDVTSADLELVAILTEFFAILQRVVDRFSGQFTVVAGIAALSDAIAELMEPTPGDEWMRTALAGVLAELESDARAGYGAAMTVAINEFGDLFAAAVRRRPIRESFRSGDITFCTLTPMRSVPYAVVCLLGMDDNAFPRLGRGKGDDLTHQAPQIGDRDPRSEDRQLLLDAVMAARRRLIVTYSSHDERTNAELQPCVPIAELCSWLARDGAIDGGNSIVTHHPLQAFDDRNFRNGELGVPGPWSFASRDLHANRALHAGNESPGFLEHELDPQELPRVEVSVLSRFLAHPVRTFFVDRLHLNFDDFTNELDCDFPLEVTRLQKWELGNELLRELARASVPDVSETVANWHDATVAAGAAPFGALGDAALGEITDLATLIDSRRREIDDANIRPRVLRVRTPAGQLIHGVVNQTEADTVVAATMSRVVGGTRQAGGYYLIAKHVLPVWLRVLMLSVASDKQVTGCLVGRGVRERKVEHVASIELVSPSDPLACLAEIAQLYVQSLRHPLPIFPNTSSAFAHATEEDRRAAVTDAWVTSGFYAHEDRDVFLTTAFGPLTVDEILADSDFGQLAHRLWRPVIASCRVRQDRI